MLSATSPAAPPSRSSTVTAAPACESLRAQARPMPLAAPVTRALRPVRSTFTEDLPGTKEATFMFLHPDEFAPKANRAPKSDRETSIGEVSGYGKFWFRGPFAGDLSEHGCGQQAVAAGAASASATAHADGRSAARVEAGYGRVVGAENPGAPHRTSMASNVSTRLPASRNASASGPASAPTAAPLQRSAACRCPRTSRPRRRRPGRRIRPSEAPRMSRP